jgi:hypothetical protein
MILLYIIYKGKTKKIKTVENNNIFCIHALLPIQIYKQAFLVYLFNK